MNYRISYVILFILFFGITNAQKTPNTFLIDSLEVVSLLNKAYTLEANAPYNAINIYKKASKLSQSIGFDLGSFRANSYAAIVFNDLTVYDSAVYYNEKALPFAKKIDYKKGIAATYINIGNTYQFFGQYDKVTSYYFKGIKIFEATHDSLNTSKSYENLAALFSAINNHEKEIEYLNLALKSNSKKNVLQYGMIYGDLGLANTKLKHLPRALTYFKKADSISKLIENDRLDFFVSRNFGEYHLKANAYEKALPFFKKALNINSNRNDEYYRTDVLIKLGETYSKLKRYKEAEKYLNQALNANKVREIQEKVYLELALIHENQGDFKSAYNYRNLSTKFSDSLKNERYVKQINHLEKQFETKKKDAEINEQNLRLKEQENQLQRKEIQTNYAIGFSILFLILSIASWLVYKQRQKQKNQELVVLKNEAQINALESLIEGEEKERFRIAKELHDGVNGDLSAIKHKLNSLLKLNNETIKETVAMIDKSCEQVRAISHNLVPPALDNFDLQTAASDYCINMDTTHQPKISFQYYGDQMVLSKIIEVNLYRIIQELVTNSIKHAKAKTIHVELSYRNTGIQLSVEDDGIGLDSSNLESVGIGISNVKHRVAFLNGEVDFSSTNEGTSVNVFIDKTNLEND